MISASDSATAVTPEDLLGNRVCPLSFLWLPVSRWPRRRGCGGSCCYGPAWRLRIALPPLRCKAAACRSSTTCCAVARQRRQRRSISRCRRCRRHRSLCSSGITSSVGNSQSRWFRSSRQRSHNSQRRRRLLQLAARPPGWMWPRQQRIMMQLQSSSSLVHTMRPCCRQMALRAAGLLSGAAAHSSQLQMGVQPGLSIHSSRQCSSRISLAGRQSSGASQIRQAMSLTGATAAAAE